MTPQESLEALQRSRALLATIERFERFDRELAPHFVFDKLTKHDFDRLHAMHIADHLSAIESD